MQSKNLFLAAAALAGVLAAAPSAHAVPLLPGTDVPAAANPIPAGSTLLADTGTQLVTASTFTANFEEWVYRDSVTGHLDFVYQVKDLSGDAIEHVTGGNYTSFSTDVGYDTSSGTAIPTDVNRSLSGATVSFNFLGAAAIAPGVTSTLLVVKTNADSFQLATAGLIDSSAASPTLAYGPAPEPSTVVMAASAGLIGLAVARFRRRKASA